MRGRAAAAVRERRRGGLRTAAIGGAQVLTNANGLTLYWFAPDTPGKSACYGSCAQYWPPLKGPVTGTGIAGTFGTIKRTDGTLQATYNGRPLYTYIADSGSRPGARQQPQPERRAVARGHRDRRRRVTTRGWFGVTAARPAAGRGCCLASAALAWKNMTAERLLLRMPR